MKRDQKYRLLLGLLEVSAELIAEEAIPNGLEKDFIESDKKMIEQIFTDIPEGAMDDLILDIGMNIRSQVSKASLKIMLERAGSSKDPSALAEVLDKILDIVKDPKTKKKAEDFKADVTSTGTGTVH